MSQSTNTQDNQSQLRHELALLETTTTNFATRFINDGKVRNDYIRQAKAYSAELLAKAESGELTEYAAAREAHQLRNKLLEIERLKSSDVGRAYAIKTKPQGTTFSALAEKYAGELFLKPFVNLAEHQKNRVYLEIIKGSGRPQDRATGLAKGFSRLGRGLAFLSLGVAVYNITTAEDKVKATAREGTVLGGGFAAGAAGGAAAGLLCGPAAVICIGIGAFVGGALGALGAEYLFDRTF